MADHPILFSAPMVRAILAGTKTQMRRAVKFGEHLPFKAPPYFDDDDPPGWWDGHGNFARCPYGQPGDRLWVRESHLLDPPIDGTWPSVGDTFAAVADIPERYRNPSYVLYRADEKLTGDWRWRPSIHMPRWASRILLEVTDVRVQRLQEISEADAKAEGVDLPVADHLSHAFRGKFHVLWESINGAGAWDANPWVWAVSFRRVTP